MFFKLTKGKSVVPADLTELQDVDERRVGFDKLGDLTISTVFLSTDHGWGGTPLFFETMIFKGDSWSELFCRRYSTYKEAKAGHDKVVEAINNLSYNIEKEEYGEHTYYSITFYDKDI